MRNTEVNMGCDIHVVVQVFVPPSKLTNGGWFEESVAMNTGLFEESVAMNTGLNDRHYWLFGRLADVRRPDDRGALFPCRGIPDGYPRDAEGEPEGDLGEHSFTWATLAELRAADWTHVSQGEPTMNLLATSRFVKWVFGPVADRLADGAGGAEHVRLVIGFDS